MLSDRIILLTTAFGLFAQVLWFWSGPNTIVSKFHTTTGSSDEKQKTVLPFAVSTIGFNLSGDGLLESLKTQQKWNSFVGCEIFWANDFLCAGWQSWFLVSFSAVRIFFFFPRTKLSEHLILRHWFHDAWMCLAMCCSETKGFSWQGETRQL
jgi:hypothetical protein